MRLPNKYGSVYKLPGNRRRPWVARITAGWKTVVAKRGKYEGQEVKRQVYQVIGYYETKPEALTALAKHQTNPVTPKANMTLEDLYNEWSAGKYQHITKATENNYRAAWKHLTPIAKLKVKEIRSTHMQGIIDNCKLSRSSLEKIRVVCVMLFDYAAENDIVSKNYAEFIRLPKSEKAKKQRFSDLEIKKLFEQDDLWTSSVLIMIYTGMRISELLNLTRFNVDLEKGIITGGVKTEAGKDRVIPIHPKITGYIKTWISRGGDTLICDDKGRKLSNKRYREDYYYPALEAAGVRKLVPHTCRHTFASMMAEAGVDTLSIQRIIGHSDYSTTANVYSHPEVESLKRAIGKI